MEKKKIIIVGAGFAGLTLARKLNNNSNYDVLLIDKFNFHQFQPLFYQVAASGLEPSNISFPLRKVFHGSKNVRFRLALLEDINEESNTIDTSIGTFKYDFLVVSTGATTNFFGNKQIEAHSFPMKSTVEALRLKNRILTNFEDALTARNPETLEEVMNIVIVGGGPTGVELSGALIEMKKNILPKDYPDMDFSKLKVHLLEGGPALLGPMSKASQETAKKYLLEMGVDVKLNTVVSDYDGHTATLKDGTTIKTKNLIWAAGVTGNVPGGIDKELTVRGNRIKVDRYNVIDGKKNIYAIGDICNMPTPKYPNGHPQLGNVAINQAKNLAKNFAAMSKGNSLTEFEYKDPGSMATVGKIKAVVDLPKLSFQGRLAWFFWMFLHLMLILTVRNRFLIFVNWAQSYFTNDSSLRVILKVPTSIKLAQLELKEKELEKENFKEKEKSN